jgi:hypothetical protein
LNDEAVLNIDDILVTDEVSQELISCIVVIELHDANILDILVTPVKIGTPTVEPVMTNPVEPPNIFSIEPHAISPHCFTSIILLASPP